MADDALPSYDVEVLTMLGQLRKRYQKAMMPIGKAIARTGITPNKITILTVLVAIVSAYFFYLGSLIIGLAFMILTIVMDMFDGAVARATNSSSAFGATLDHTLDRYAEFIFMFGLMLGPMMSTTKFIPWEWGYFTLFGMIMASFTRAKAESVGGMESCTVGIAERQEKLILTIAGIIMLSIDPIDGWLGYSSYFPSLINDWLISLGITNILTLCIVIVGILSHITVVQRLRYAQRMTSGRAHGERQQNPE